MPDQGPAAAQFLHCYNLSAPLRRVFSLVQGRRAQETVPQRNGTVHQFVVRLSADNASFGVRSPSGDMSRQRGLLYHGVESLAGIFEGTPGPSAVRSEESRDVRSAGRGPGHAGSADTVRGDEGAEAGMPVAEKSPDGKVSGGASDE